MKNTIWSMAGQGIAAVFGLGTFMLLARLVSPEVLGDFLLNISGNDQAWGVAHCRRERPAV